VTEFKIVRVVGRWAILDNGDQVTPVPAFVELVYSAQEFDDRIAAFQADPLGELRRCGIREHISARRGTA
jgi:hypothetical protein